MIPALVLDCYKRKNGEEAVVTLGDLSGGRNNRGLPMEVLFNKKNIQTESKQLILGPEAISTIDEAQSSHEDTLTAPSTKETPIIGTIPSRVLKDAFHIMDMIKVPLRHRLAKDFARRFRDTLFVVDQNDRRSVERYLVSIGSDWNTCFFENPDFILERVRRYISPAAELLPALKRLFEGYGPSLCKDSGQTLFDHTAREMANHILKSVQLGHVSDLAGGPSLYVVKGIDKNGLTMYRCCRGTSSVEGAVHMNIIRKLASYNAGPRLTDMVLADYRLYHNLDAGSKNRHGKLYKSHYCPWLTQAINTIRIEIGHGSVTEYYGNSLGNCFEYGRTKETFGITSFPKDLVNIK
jgi:hypothetical protein